MLKGSPSDLGRGPTENKEKGKEKSKGFILADLTKLKNWQISFANFSKLK